MNVPLALRDNWPQTPIGPEREAIWNMFWRPGGLYDEGRSTHRLPNTNRWN